MSARIAITGWGSVRGTTVDGTLGGASPAAPQHDTLRWRQVSQRPCERFGRLDIASRCALAAAEMLALPLPSEGDRFPRVGAVLATRACSLDADFHFLSELRAGNASPALFTYTLPSAGLAEIAIRFRLAGPTMCLVEESDAGNTALWEALDLLWRGDADACLCVECDAISGTAADALSLNANSLANALLLERPDHADRAAREPIAWIDRVDGLSQETADLSTLCEWLSTAPDAATLHVPPTRSFLPRTHLRITRP